MNNSFYGPHNSNGLSPESLYGHLIVVEGADGSGRSTQITLLTELLENSGYKVVNVGIKRSSLVSDELNVALSGNILSKRTMTLFYATDFADQMVNTIIPALKSGFIVICDRYFYTHMARSIVRGQPKEWLEEIFSFALKPDLIFNLQVSPNLLIERNLDQKYCLDFWESGMDIGLADNLFDSFVMYQSLIHDEFVALGNQYPFIFINGDHDTEDVFTELKNHVLEFLS